MAALRIFARTAFSGIRGSLTHNQSKKNTFLIIQQRWATMKIGYGHQEKEVELPDFEVSKDPAEWKYVEWTLQGEVVPSPPSEVKEYPSGWKPQSHEVKSLPYMVERTKNHMIPVYLRRTHRGTQRQTIIRKVQGDIVGLEKELRNHLEPIACKKIGSQINEPAGLIKFRGDYVNLCKIYLNDKGF
ncbi:probable 39S ribosomal protein L49, mitochondrial isoform X2 [Venturia canescens]|uniref:probable 39S ribosomal protein L49, mitochondrial isoform X2 n=1 Tax=Venturia canescens TaxID=32260 RepID=UPI001C9BFE66|nr:probable 39S ribosomal protein L49, mitochondrial isoform X2 [Venturia canescens]